MFFPKPVLIGLSLLAIVGGSAKAAKDTADDPANCRDRLEKMICIVEPVWKAFRHENALGRECLEGSNRYRSTFIAIFNTYPKRLQTVMCRLNRIFVEKSFFASGYAHVKANSIGIHQDALDKRPELGDFATWKERLAYSRPAIEENRREPLPIVSSRLPLSLPGTAYFIVAHELGHLIDKKLGASAKGAGPFASLSWSEKDNKVLPQTLPLNWKRPCFYLCRIPKYAVTRPSSAYVALKRSAFVSLAATINPAEDFAETLTFYVMSKLPAFQYLIRAGGLTIDIKQKLTTAIMRPKVRYMENLLRRSERDH
jgi:hypothetical protein